MTATEAREYLGKCLYLATGRMRIESTEKRLRTDLVDIMRDDDLVVIFTEDLREHLAPAAPPERQP